MTKNYNENSIREAAYYNWQNAGCPAGQDEYFWTMAINQLYGSNCCNSCSCKKSAATKSSSAKSGSAKKASAKKSSGK